MKGCYGIYLPFILVSKLQDNDSEWKLLWYTFTICGLLISKPQNLQPFRMEAAMVSICHVLSVR